MIEQVSNGAAVASYNYDLQNRMVGATLYSTNASGQAVATTTVYTYDSGGNLVGEATSISIAGVFQSSNQVTFLNDRLNPTGIARSLRARDSSGAPQVTYVLGTQILAQADAAGNLRFLASDALGSTRLLTNAAGAITDRFDFDAYGNALDFDPATAATKILFAGQIYDSGSGQYDMRARFYDPATGQFTSPRSIPGTPIIRSPSTHMATPTATRRITDPSGHGFFWALVGIDVHSDLGVDFLTKVPPPRISDAAISGILEAMEEISAVPFVALPEIGPVFAFLDARCRPLVHGHLQPAPASGLERHAQWRHLRDQAAESGPNCKRVYPVAGLPRQLRQPNRSFPGTSHAAAD